jgi:hypothetical protein
MRQKSQIPNLRSHQENYGATLGLELILSFWDTLKRQRNRARTQVRFDYSIPQSGRQPRTLTLG